MLAEAGQAEAARDGPEGFLLELGGFLGCVSDGGHDEVLEQFDIVGVDDFRLKPDPEDLLLAGHGDPDGAADYRQRADNYRQQLEELDTAIRQELQQVPPPRRVLITAHDAFRYFGRAYGFEVVGLQGVSTASELGTQQRDRLAELIVRRQIPAVFTETSVPSEGLAAVLDDVRRKGGPAVRLISGEKALYSDALGPPDSPAGTYIGMIRHNVRVIVEALGP